MILPPPQTKSFRPQITIDADTTNYNLASDLTNNHGWDGTSAIDAKVKILPGVTVSATATTTAAFHADLVSGSTLKLDNHGTIVGKGGSGGGGGSGSGGAGGHAISLQDVSATINNVPSSNLLLHSEAIDNAAWTKVGSPTISANASSVNMMKMSQTIQSGLWLKLSTVIAAPFDDVLAPDGTMTAEGVQASNNQDVQHRVYQSSVSLPASTHVTGSIYVKAAAQSWVSLAVYSSFGSMGARRWVNLATGAVGTNGDFNTPVDPHFSVEDAGSGWYRIIAGVRSAGVGTFTMTVGITDTDGELSYSAGSNFASDQVYLWGGQMEIGTVASAYEETGATANPPIANPINGSQTVDLFTRTSATDGRAYQSVAKPALNQTYTYSAYARRSVGDYFTLRLQGTWPGRADAIFNLKTGAIVSCLNHGNFSDASATIDSVGGDFYRCTVTGTSDTAASIFPVFAFNSNGVQAQSADSISNSAGYIWGQQLELTNKNLLPHPQAIDQWTNVSSDTGVLVNSMAAPDGSMTMDQVRRNIGSTNPWARRSSIAGPVETDTLYTVSGYFKAPTSTNTNKVFVTFIQNNLQRAEIAFTFSNGTPTLNAYSYGGATSTQPILRDVGNGFWRVSFEVLSLASGAGSTGYHINIFPDGGTTGNDYMGVWGVQVEKGFLTEYIPETRNLVDYPESFDQWTAGSSPTITSDTVVNPISGQQTADTVAGTHTYSSLRRVNITLAASTPHTLSIYLKTNTSVKHRIGIYDESASLWLFEVQTAWSNGVPSTSGGTNIASTAIAYTDVGNGWWRMSMAATTGSNTNYSVYLYPSYGSAGQSVYAYGAQLEKGAKNLVEYPEDFSNSYWTKVNGATAVHNPNSVNINPYSENAKLNYTTVQSVTITENVAAAPDGKFTADRIEDTSSASSGGTQYTQKNMSITPSSGTYTWSFYILKDSNTSRFPLFALGLYGGSLGNQHKFGWLNTSTGAVQNGTGGGALTSISSESVGDYWRLALTVTNNGENNLIYTQVYPAHAASLGGNAPGTLTGSVTFAHSQVQAGSTASAYEPKFTNSSYVKMLAPNGTETANLMTAGGAQWGALVARKYLPASDIDVLQTYTLSCYVKKINHRYIQLRIPSNNEATWDFDTKTFLGVSNTVDSTGYEELPDGWFRIWSTAPQPTSSSLNTLLDIAMADSSGSHGFTPAGTEQFYLWGAQFERGPLTPYEEASGYIAIGNKSTRYQPVSANRDAKILGSGGGGGGGGSVSGHGSAVDTEGECTGGSSHSGANGGAGAGPGAAINGTSIGGPAASGGNGGTYGEAGQTAGSGGGTGCSVSNGAGGAGGAAGKAIHHISGVTQSLNNGGEIAGATS